MSEKLGLVGADSLTRLDGLARSLRDEPERWALFLGAGMSRGAGLPLWKDLVVDIAHQFGVPCDPDMLIAANYIPLMQRCRDEAPNQDAFWDAIHDRLCIDVQPPKLQELPFELPFEVFATTNIDCLATRTHARVEPVKSPRVVSYPAFEGMDVGGRRLVHFHGRCACGGDGERLSDDTAVLTQSGYDRAYSNSSALPTLGVHLFLRYRVLFVGASVDDPALIRLLETARKQLAITESRLPGSTPRHAALISTPHRDAGPEMEWSFPADVHDQIFYYNPEGGNHELLGPIIEWLGKEVVPIAGRPEAEPPV